MIDMKLFIYGIASLLLCNSARAIEVTPITEHVQVDAKKSQMGEAIFNSVVASKNGLVSCATCHSFKNGGADGLAFSMDGRGKVYAVNTPSIFNLHGNIFHGWASSAKTLEAYIYEHIEQHSVLGTSHSDIWENMLRDKALVKKFDETFRDGYQGYRFDEVLAQYVLTLVTPSRFDRYLRGDKAALSNDELAGYEKFKEYECGTCHSGTNLGGSVIQERGGMRHYFDKHGVATHIDLGRFSSTKLETDKYVFRTPSLRNVALTDPYFHDGSALTLHDAVNAMFKYQIGRHAPESDKELVVKFLHSLTGEKLNLNNK